MNPEEKQLLEEAVKLSKENNKILHKMRRGQFLGNLFSYVKWILIIIITVWSWVVLQPYLDNMMNMYQQVQDATKSVNELKVKAESSLDASGLQNIIDKFRIGTQ